MCRTVTVELVHIAETWEAQCTAPFVGSILFECAMIGASSVTMLGFNIAQKKWSTPT